MIARSVRLRRASDGIVKGVSVAAALVGIFFLGWILTEVVRRGVGAFDWNFFTKRMSPTGLPGGVANAMLGTALITGVATIIGVPLGLLAGVYLAEFGRHSRLATVARFMANVLIGMPSIIIGVFVYALLVMGRGFSGLAGAVALAIIMLPVVTRTAEDMLNLVPNALRESALALGAPRWKVTLGIVFRAAKAGLLTGVLLAVARVSGETAPLLFTALNSEYWPESLFQPTANLPVTINTYAAQPADDLLARAWGASLVITVAVLCITVIARLLLKARKT